MVEKSHAGLEEYKLEIEIEIEIESLESWPYIHEMCLVHVFECVCTSAERCQQ